MPPQSDKPCPNAGEVNYRLANALRTLENVQNELDSCNERLAASQISVSKARKEIESARNEGQHSKESPSQNSAEFLTVKEECSSLKQRIIVMEAEMESLREKNCRLSSTNSQLRESQQFFMNECKCETHIVGQQPLVHIKEEINETDAMPALQLECSTKHELEDNLNDVPQLSPNRSSEFDVHFPMAPMKEIEAPDTDKVSPKKLDGKDKDALICSQCSKSFTSHRLFQSHAHRAHVGLTSGTLNKHECGGVLGREGRKHVCPHCNKKYTLAKTLERHLQTHAEERPFECNECKKRFKLIGDLKRHERIHTGEKPFKCKWCKKRFNQSTNRNSHEQKSHTGKKAYRCRTCSYSCSDYGTLLKHKSTHVHKI